MRFRRDANNSLGGNSRRFNYHRFTTSLSYIIIRGCFRQRFTVTVRKESVGCVIGNSINAPRLFGTADRAHLSSRPNIICNNPVSKDSGSHDYLLHALQRTYTILRDSRKTQTALCAVPWTDIAGGSGAIWINQNLSHSFLLIKSTYMVIDIIIGAK